MGHTGGSTQVAWRMTMCLVRSVNARSVPRPVDASTATSGDAARADRARRHLQWALGAIWLLDAALQLQPAMFTKAFVTQTLASTAAGNPGFIARPITWAAAVILHHEALYNVAFAGIQLAIGLGLFWRRTVKAALLGSLAWSLAVWWLGEGLGGVLTGGTSPFMGAPGAVILYGFVALVVWPRRSPSVDGRLGTSGPLGSALPRLCWLALWGSFAFFGLQPGMRSPNSLSAMVGGMAAGEPRWVRSVDSTLAGTLAGHGDLVVTAMIVLWVVIGLSVFGPRRVARIGVILAVTVGLMLWLVQDFGGIFTGQATDPDSGPLLVLLALVFWPRGSAEPPGRWTRRDPHRRAVREATSPVEVDVPGGRGLETGVEAPLVGTRDDRCDHRGGQAMPLPVRTRGQNPEIPVGRHGLHRADGLPVLVHPLPDRRTGAFAQGVPDVGERLGGELGATGRVPHRHSGDVVGDPDVAGPDPHVERGAGKRRREVVVAGTQEVGPCRVAREGLGDEPGDRIPVLRGGSAHDAHAPR
jgi:hypothetical protein